MTSNEILHNSVSYMYINLKEKMLPICSDKFLYPHCTLKNNIKLNPL
mgnify:CR=1 FL=1